MPHCPGEWGPVTCTSVQAWVTSAPWQMVHPPQTLAVDSTSSRYINCYSIRTWWCVQKASMARWEPCSSPSKSFPSGMLLHPQSILPMNLQLMVVDLGSMQSGGIITTNETPNSTPVLPLPCSRYCWAFQWHHCSNQPGVLGHHGVIATGFSCCPSLCLLAQHTKETANIWQF